MLVVIHQVGFSSHPFLNGGELQFLGSLGFNWAADSLIGLVLQLWAFETNFSNSWDPLVSWVADNLIGLIL